MLAEVIDAVCSHLSQAGIFYYPGATATYKPSAGQVPVTAKRLPSTWDTAAAVNVYSQALPLPGSDTVMVSFQLHVRASPTADILADRAVEALHGVHAAQWGTLHVDRCAHLHTAQLGADEKGLDHRTDNFQLIFHTKGN